MLLLKSVQSILKRSGLLELANLIGLILMAIPLLFEQEFLLLFGVVVAVDIARFILCGTWFYAPFHGTAHRQCPQKDYIYRCGVIVKRVCYAIALLLLLLHAVFGDKSVIANARCFVWFVITTVSVIELLRTLAHVAHKWNDSWLGASDGELTVAEICVFARIALALMVAQSALSKHPVIALCLIGIYILADEFIEACIFRLSDLYPSRIYGWCDLFCDKLLYIANAIAVIIVIARERTTANDASILICVSVSIAVACVYDIMMGFWHVMGHYRLRLNSVGRSYAAATVRRFCVYAFLAICYATPLVNDDDWGKLVVIASIGICAISIIVLCMQEYYISRERLYFFDGPY